MSKYQKIFFAILTSSAALRVFLILSGGQYFWPDEHRYEISRAAVDELLLGNLRVALLTLHTAINPLFKVFGVLPAMLENFLGENLHIPALFFAIFSVLNLRLIWKIVRSLGGSEREALFAALLLSLSNTFFYYSRHLLPYDTAMAFALLAILVGIGSRARARNSFLSGFLALCTFLIYSGYWPMVAVAFLAQIFYAGPRAKRAYAQRAALFGTGFLFPLVIILVASSVFVESKSLLEQFLSFSGTIVQGSYSEGWSLPFAYLWHAEHALLLFWIASSIYSLWLVSRKKFPPRVTFGLLGLGVVYAALVGFSTVLEVFVVYGRLARQLVPFFCLLAAHSLENLWGANAKARQLATILVTVVILQTGINFYKPLVQVFPNGFHIQAAQVTETFEEGEYAFRFAQFIHPDALEVPAERPHSILTQSAHPLEFLPYQYEGYTPGEREWLQSTDISMRLIIYE